MTYFQAAVIGLLQGVSELFPVSSLGHSVLVPALFGWHNLVGAQSADESFYLAFLVGLHVATALALVVYFRRDWIRIAGGLTRSLRSRRIDDGDADARLGWLLVAATIPVGLTGLLFEHWLRTVFAKPGAAAAFLMLNGVILLAGERLRRQSVQRVAVGANGAAEVVRETPESADTDVRLATLNVREATGIGAAQILALFAGISRSGATMAAGLLRGLDHDDAARFSFLLATPIILAAGVYKLPDLLGPLGNGIRPQVLVGSLCAGVAAWLSIRFLVRWFTTRTLTPFAVYSLIAGGLALLRFH
ncbi:MAG TPA: undecaprenyl-diphosphate phosphatase [Acidimicrobiia bacterium]|nr:undecaprenyl-diphosphate phosphatase [Acidimicrobiia bacterium]